MTNEERVQKVAQMLAEREVEGASAPSTTPRIPTPEELKARVWRVWARNTTMDPWRLIGEDLDIIKAKRVRQQELSRKHVLQVRMERA